MKPTPKNPKIIIAQVEGSGTGGAKTTSKLSVSNEFWPEAIVKLVKAQPLVSLKVTTPLQSITC